MRLQSSALADGGVIPKKYSYRGGNINPPLEWSDVPAGTGSFVLIMDDPDAPAGLWVHWVVFNIPSAIREIPEAWQIVGARGAGTTGSLEYEGPQPPDKEHRYAFHLFALDGTLPLSNGASKDEVEAGMKGHILAKAALTGRYSPDN